MTTHPPCGKAWAGVRAEHCPACCETFVGRSAGDRHRAGAFHGRRGRRCVPRWALPALGLLLDERGIWGTTGHAPAAPPRRPA